MPSNPADKAGFRGKSPVKRGETMKQKIKKAAVLGAGVMGSAIAAHLANVGIPSFLLDIVPPELSEAEKKKGLTFQSPEVRNRFAVQGKNRIQETRPASLYLKDDAELLTVGNFEDHLSWVSEADWIIEVVIEDLNLKRDLFKKLILLKRRNGGQLEYLWHLHSEDGRRVFTGLCRNVFRDPLL